MLLESYRLEIFNSECNPHATAVHCFAHLDQDVSEALPYLNTVLGGFEYVLDPPSVVFNQVRGLDIHCGCFSTETTGGPADLWTVARDISFLAMSVYLALCLFVRPSALKTASAKR